MLMVHSHAMFAILGIGPIGWPLDAAGPDPASRAQPLLDLALEPPRINTAPGPEYGDEARSFGMVIGMDRTPRGRLWAAWGLVVITTRVTSWRRRATTGLLTTQTVKSGADSTTSARLSSGCGRQRQIVWHQGRQAGAADLGS